MVKTQKIIIGLSFVIVGVLAAVFFFPNEEKRVKKQFVLLSEWVSKDPGENTFTMAHKVRSIGNLFAENCDLKASVPSISDRYAREEISSIALQSRGHFYNLSLKFYDLNISFPEKEIANVTLTGRLTGRSTLGEEVDETCEFECLLKKTGKKWLFSHFEVVEVLKK